MTTSLVPLDPFDAGSGEISDGTYAYFNSRNRMHVFSLVNEEFERVGLSQAEIARRMRKGTDRVCRLLNSPGNWTLDTVSELLLAISGAEVVYSLAYPCKRAPVTLNQTSEPIAVKIPDTNQKTNGYILKVDGRNRDADRIVSLV